MFLHHHQHHNNNFWINISDLFQFYTGRRIPYYSELDPLNLFKIFRSLPYY